MIKRFISYYKPHKRLFALDMICAFLVAALDLIFPMASRNIINVIIPSGNLKMLYIYSAVLVGLYILKLIFNYIVDYWGHVVGVRMQYHMRKEVFAHLQSLPFSFFDNTKTGHLMSRIVNDLMEVSELAHHGPEDVFISIVMIVGSFIMLCTINWKLTVIVFAFIPLMLWFAMKKRAKMTEAFRNTRKTIAIVNAKLENSISGIRVSKSFTNEEYEMEKFDEGNIEFLKSREIAYKSLAEFFSGITFMVDILQVVVIFIGGIFVTKKLINIGDLFAYVLYIGFFMQPIRRLTSFVEQFQAGMTGFERFIEIMDIESDIVEKEDAIELMDVKGNIEFKDLSFNYNNKSEVLTNINLKIEEGKTVALVGPSGGGKTTLCHLIPRFYEATEGQILIDGKDIKDLTLKSLRKNIGMVQQDVFLFTGTIKENILYGNPEASEEDVIKAAKEAKLHHFIMGLPNKYDTFIGERGVKLSGGQKQRLSIARVFLKNPPILILDEATSALDNETEIMIQKSLEELCKGRTTLVVAHRLSTVKNADEIIVLTDKGIEEKGSHDELIKEEGIYYRLYNSQFKGYI